MFKLRVTNTSAKRDGGRHARPIFLTEAGRLLQPGDAVPVNRLNKGTDDLVNCEDLSVEEGNFPPYVEAKKTKKPVVDEDDEDDDRPKITAKKVASTEKATLVTVTKKRSSKIVPLVAAGADDADEKETEAMSASNDDDDLDIPSVTKADITNATGLKDLEPPAAAPEQKPSSAGFHDNHNVGKSKN